MTATLVTDGQLQIPIASAAPAALACTGSYVVLDGSEIDARAWRCLAYTILPATNAADWQVCAANAPDFSDEIIVKQGTAIAAGAPDTYVVELAPYAYYRVKAKNNGGSVSTVTVRGVAKR